MQIECPRLTLRPWRPGDEKALVRHANNPKIWRNLRDRFPHPYVRRNAVDWIRRAIGTPGDAALHFAIVYAGEPVGGIGLERLSDVHRGVAEIGYWLAEEHWGKGFATETLVAVTGYAFASFELERLEAGVFEWNAASCRVLEKAGYHLEARLRRRVVKDGRTIDELLYVRLRDRVEPVR
jgi:ribosomal-protein-alanine N-acetyltransferase